MIGSKGPISDVPNAVVFRMLRAGLTKVTGGPATQRRPRLKIFRVAKPRFGGRIGMSCSPIGSVAVRAWSDSPNQSPSSVRPVEADPRRGRNRSSNNQSRKLHRTSYVGSPEVQAHARQHSSHPISLQSSIQGIARQIEMMPFYT